MELRLASYLAEAPSPLTLLSGPLRELAEAQGLDSDEPFDMPTVGLLTDEGAVELGQLIGEAGFDPGCMCTLDLVDLLACPDCLRLVRAAAQWYERRSPRQKAQLVTSLDKAHLLPPVIPERIFCLAGNYMSHINESGGEHGKEVERVRPPNPRIFLKPTTNTLRASGAPLQLSPSSSFVDYEGEMAVVICRHGKYISAEDAMEYVGGVTILNDISERRLRVWPNDEPLAWDRFFYWLNGKWMDGFAPLGPCVRPISEIPDVHNLRLQTHVNGERVQDASTSEMIFKVPEIIEYLSQMMSLEPGDVIATGTPAGVGSSRGVALKAGDEVVVELEGVGQLVTPVVDETLTLGELC